MIKTGLKSFDISSFNLEIEFNKRVAPITKKIDTLNKNNEKKSLASHKDFLTKEKKFKKKLNELSEKALLRNQRIAIATENKLKKYIGIEERIGEDYIEANEALRLKNINANKELDERVKEFKVLEQDDLKLVSTNFAESIGSYNEKLALFNTNYKENVLTHNTQLKSYQTSLDTQLENLKAFKTAFEVSLAEDLTKINEFVNGVNEALVTRQKEVSKEMNSSTTKVRRNANLKISNLKDFIEELKKRNVTKYDNIIEDIQNNISRIGNDFSDRKALIEEDLEMNVLELTKLIEDPDRTPSKALLKTTQLKIALYETRATTTISYEERMCDEQVKLLNDTLEQMNNTKAQELLNVEKLEVFLLEDQNQFKDTADYFKNLNIELQKLLADVELYNNDFIIKHTKLRNEYLRKYKEIYNEFELSVLESNKVHLEEISDINLEIDEINKFIDTSEPLKEIQVNKIRESLEKNEVSERYQVTFAKLNHEKAIINSEYERDLELETLKNELQRTENNKFISDINAKEILDKEVEKAKLRFNKAGESDRLRLNSIRLERNLLKSNYETEIGFLEFRKELSSIDVEYEISLYTTEIENKINNISVEQAYKEDIVNQSLIEQSLKLQDEIKNILVGIDNNEVSLDIEVTKEKNVLEKYKQTLLEESEEKEKLIDKALRRELTGPKKSLERANEVIDDRLSKFDRTKSIYESFIKDMIQNISDADLTNEQRTEIVKNDTLLLERSREFISKTYRYLYEAVDFMNNLDQQTIKNKETASVDGVASRKIQKLLQKSQVEFEKQISNLDNARKAHTNSITDDIKAGIEQIIHFEFVDKSQLEVCTDLYNNVFTGLESLQDNVATEVRELYSILTKSDEDRINHAQENAINSKALLVEERETAVIPLVEAFELFIDTTAKAKESFKQLQHERIEELNTGIENLKGDSEANVAKIKEELNEFLLPLTAQLSSIKTTRDNNYQSKIDALEHQVSDLNAQFEGSLGKLKQKENDSQKILDYEKQIYDIAAETAETKYNDIAQSSETSYLNLLQSLEKKKSSNYAEHEKRLYPTNKAVQDLTKNYEQNIFAVKPKLEESIGDAQKVIDYELSEKQKRLEFLLLEKQKITLQLDENQNSSYDQCYQKLIDAFNFYFDKLKLIRNDYMKQNKEFDSVINDNSTNFAHALFELSKTKHEKTLQRLMEINGEMTGEDDTNG